MAGRRTTLPGTRGECRATDCCLLPGTRYALATLSGYVRTYWIFNEYTNRPYISGQNGIIFDDMSTFC